MFFDNAAAAAVADDGDEDGENDNYDEYKNNDYGGGVSGHAVVVGSGVDNDVAVDGDNDDCHGVGDSG